jgi:hypothetical protein
MIHLRGGAFPESELLHHDDQEVHVLFGSGDYVGNGSKRLLVLDRLGQQGLMRGIQGVRSALLQNR